MLSNVYDLQGLEHHLPASHHNCKLKGIWCRAKVAVAVPVATSPVPSLEPSAHQGPGPSSRQSSGHTEAEWLPVSVAGGR